MGRYFKLYLQFIVFSFGKAAMFRFDFWCRILMDCAYYAVAIGFFKILFLKTPSLAGWTQEQVMIFVGAQLTLDAIQMTILSGNLWELPSTINKGGLDHYLVKPVSTLFFLSFREIAIPSIVNFIMAVSFFIYSLNQYTGHFSAFQFISFLFFLGIGFLIFFGMRLMVALPVFWTQAPYGLERIFYSMLPLMERPDMLFRGPLRLLIITIIPFALVVSFPARIFFDGVTFSIAGHMILILILQWVLVFWIWNKGLGSYSSASS